MWWWHCNQQWWSWEEKGCIYSLTHQVYLPQDCQPLHLDWCVRGSGFPIGPPSPRPQPHQAASSACDCCVSRCDSSTEEFVSFTLDHSLSCVTHPQTSMPKSSPALSSQGPQVSSVAEPLAFMLCLSIPVLYGKWESCLIPVCVYSHWHMCVHRYLGILVCTSSHAYVCTCA